MTLSPNLRAVRRPTTSNDRSRVAHHELAMQQSWGLTFDMSGDRRQAQPAGGRPLDGGVRRHFSYCNRATKLVKAFHSGSLPTRNRTGVAVLPLRPASRAAARARPSPV